MRALSFVAGALLAPVALALVVFAFAVHASWSGWAYAIGTAMIAAGLFGGARGPTRRTRRRPGLAGSGCALVAAGALVHVFAAARGNHLAMTTTAGGSARWLGRIVDEGDGATLGAHLIAVLGLIHDPDIPAVPRAMRDAYAEMRAEEGDAPSPVVPTYLGLQTPERADVVVVEPASEPAGAVVFLHGFGGNYALPCWEVARAAAELHLVTYCPSVGWEGRWWTSDGERTVRATVRMARARGLDRVWLAGLSNGAIGASLLAPRMRGELRGLILVSGASPDAGAPGIPALVLQGDRDAMCPASIAHAYAARASATYVRLDAGHFAMLLRRHEAHRAIAAWLSRT